MRTMVLASLLWLAIAPGSAVAQVKAHLPANITPPWSKGIQPISRESYWNAMSCGKQPGARPACVFYDAELCANDEFTLAFYTPYKQVAYTVWQAVSRKQPPPTPSYADAQRMRIIIGVRRTTGTLDCTSVSASAPSWLNSMRPKTWSVGRSHASRAYSAQIMSCQ